MAPTGTPTRKAQRTRNANSRLLTSVSGKAFDLPVYYDVEEKAQAQKGKEFVTSVILAFAEEVEKSGLHSRRLRQHQLAENYIALDKLGGRSIWKADWSQEPDESIACDIHQYTLKRLGKRHFRPCGYGYRLCGVLQNPEKPAPMPEPEPTPEPEPAFLLRRVLRVRTKAHGWLSEVRTSRLRGLEGKPGDHVTVKVSAGAVKYRVHVKGGSWLPWM